MRRMRHDENARIEGGREEEWWPVWDPPAKGLHLRDDFNSANEARRERNRRRERDEEWPAQNPHAKGSHWRGISLAEDGDFFPSGEETTRRTYEEGGTLGGDAPTPCGRISSRRSLLGAGSCQVDRRAPPARRTEDGGRWPSYRRMEDRGAPIGVWRRSSHQTGWGLILPRPALAKWGWGLLFPPPLSPLPAREARREKADILLPNWHRKMEHHLPNCSPIGERSYAKVVRTGIAMGRRTTGDDEESDWITVQK